MSLVLTTTLARTVVDLTGESPPSSQPRPRTLAIASTPQAPRTRHRQASRGDEPSSKRRCTEGASSSRLSLKSAMLKQIQPHVIKAIAGLSTDVYRVDDIAIKAIVILAKSPSFRIAVDESNIRPLALAPAEALQLAVGVVNQLKTQPQFQIKTPDPPRAIASDSSPKVEPRPADRAPPAPSPAVAASRPNRVEPHGKPRAQPTKKQRPRQARGLALGPSHSGSKWFRLKSRPYMPASERKSIARGSRRHVSSRYSGLEWPLVYHADFSADEVDRIFTHLAGHVTVDVPHSLDSLTALCNQHNVASLVGDSIPGRTAEDVRNFCSDLVAGQASAPTNLKVLSLEKITDEQHKANKRINRIPSLLLARETEGNARFGRTRRYENFQNEFRKAREDGLVVIAEFTNCAGDISAMSWVPDDNILCGTTAHSDAHNQQYNKPGNLLLCSASQGKLRAFPDHRIPRPLVEKGENSTEAMRRSQDPWLYSSVVSSDYDQIHNRAFTSSFDRTVKVWHVSKDGSHMEAVATWHHGGNVNFVAAAKDGSGRVASAADVPTGAVRIYTIDAQSASNSPQDLSDSPYTAISCTRTDANDSDKWAYFPATMQWGRAPGTTHLLVVGYSPRSLTHDDRDIPEDKRDSGEILLWDAERKCRIPVMTASTANVFEIAWHPSLARFIVATSPSGLTIEHGVRTQVHLFQLDRERLDGAYHEVQCLDCPASDINELTFMPNSPRHAYVTAACTDGNTYVWDTAQGDQPIHVLKHGYPLDDFTYDREKEDTGVKFTAWGTTPDRLYTGSSDGVVKVWNVRNRRKPFVRNLLEAPAPISIGAFSPDSSKLAVGDATGRVFLFSVDDRDKREEHFITIPGTNRKIRRPTPFIPHAEPPPPEDPNGMDVDDGEHSADQETSIAAYSRHKYLDSRQLVLHRDPVIGAVQGPEYASTGLFLREAHLADEPLAPLKSVYTKLQQEPRPRRRRSKLRLRDRRRSSGDGRRSTQLTSRSTSKV
ncbi:hypothetical protein HIM_02952 [Hirsutella minnesotensis 3608]|nr:hypothetical protein HIM_02952 [Hirsutella minnesotensis 3608]